MTMTVHAYTIEQQSCDKPPPNDTNAYIPNAEAELLHSEPASPLPSSVVSAVVSAAGVVVVVVLCDVETVGTVGGVEVVAVSWVSSAWLSLDAELKKIVN